MNAHRSWVVALTGGVASGKSAVTARFQALGVAVHDADVAAREAVAAGSAGLQAIVAAFGDDVLDARGELDRRAMRERVFRDQAARRKLESIVHPAVRARLQALVDADRGPYCMLAIPLLTETWPQYDWVDRVAVVDAPDALRLERLMQRDDVDAALAHRMIASQATREQRLELADDVIDNSGTLADLDPQVRALHQRYMEHAEKRG